MRLSPWRAGAATRCDVLMPAGDGLEMRRRGNRPPVLMLTARDGVADRVTGVDAGAGS